MAKNFEEHEIETAIKNIKIGKAAGLDEIYQEIIKSIGPKFQKWLPKFYSDVLKTGKLPKQSKKTKILAILKPGKPNKDVKSYHLISHLCVGCKLLERVIRN